MGSTFEQFHLDEFLLWKAHNGVSDGALRKYRFAIQYFMRWITTRPVTDIELMTYMAYIHHAEISDEYRKTNAMTLKSALLYLRSAGYDFPEPKFRAVKIHKKKKSYLQTDQIHAVLSAKLSKRDHIALRLFLVSGIRPFEMVALRWDDINWKSGVINILEGKGPKYRTVVVDKKTLFELLRYKNSTSPDNHHAPVIANYKTNMPLKTMGLRSLVLRAMRKIGIKFTPYTLRRTFARQASINGMDVAWIQQLMGHASIEMTKQYIQDLDVDDIVTNYNKFPPIPF
jgi:integrase/recombinase XerD